MKDSQHDEPTLRRRSVIRAGLLAGAGVAGAAGAAAPTAAQEGYGGWLSDVSNYDGSAVNRTGEDEVEIRVGVEANGGPYGFGPAAVAVSPGTTVVWRWTGSGGDHNVVHRDGAFESDLTDEAGFTFSHTFEETGAYRYACVPHEQMGMKGVVEVTEDAGGPIGYGGWLSDVPNYDGTTVDATGQDEATVRVGTQTTEGPYGFGPPAVHVDPGTTVVWEWTGAGGDHNVVDQDGAFESDLTDESGFTFSHTFEETGLYKYYCAPHEPLGMKGAVAVGDVGTGEATPTPEPSGGEEAEGGDPLTVRDTFVLGFFGTAGLGVLALFGAEWYNGYRAFRTSQPERGVYAQEASGETHERTLEHDEYDPTGTATLVAVYFVIVVLLWLFMYFVEFLDGGPTVVG
jgi:halocyanin-like protein